MSTSDGTTTTPTWRSNSAPWTAPRPRTADPDATERLTRCSPSSTNSEPGDYADLLRPDPPSCIRTHTEIGITASSALDSKKRELVGDFKAVGREFEPTGRPVQVRSHDFKDKDLGHAIPFGVLDLSSDEGWVNVGIDGNTAEFAVNSILGWWEHLGRKRYPHAKTLTITADCGGANSNRVRLWKVELQRLADSTGLQIIVCHFPPGTSKWNKIEHRLFSFMSLNWRGKPLESHEVIINLIAGTTTSTGLKVYAQLDKRPYPTRIEVTDEQLAAVKIERHAFHGEWNYRITPSLIET